MDQMREGIAWATVVMDDILVAGRDIGHHDRVLKRVIQWATSYNLQLNFRKCLIRQSLVPYVGHLLTAKGVLPDPLKTKAVEKMPRPTDKQGVKRFLGFVQHLGKFIPNLSDTSKPLRDLCKADMEFCWQSAQELSFEKLKQACISAPVLQYDDVNQPVEIQADTRQNAGGACLLQNGNPRAFTSHSLTDTECCYAMIEKEMLSIIHATVQSISILHL